MQAVTHPTGSSTGMAMVRANVSHTITNHPPANAEKGMRMRLSDPNSKRLMCGMMRPAKPITPDADTTKATMSADIKRTKKVVSFTGMPNE